MASEQQNRLLLSAAAAAATVAAVAVAGSYGLQAWVEGSPLPANQGKRKSDATRAQRRANPTGTPTRTPDHLDAATADKVDIEAAAARFMKAIPARTGLRYLVVGVGFLGSHLVEVLLKRGESNITVLDLRIPPQWAAQKVAGVTAVQCDITDAEQVASVMEQGKFDVVICTAAFIGYADNLPWQYERNYRVNVLGVRNLLQAAKASGVKVFVHTSTSHVHLDVSADFDMDEDFGVAKQPENHYTSTKLLGEQEVRMIPCVCFVLYVVCICGVCDVLGVCVVCVARVCGCVCVCLLWKKEEKVCVCVCVFLCVCGYLSLSLSLSLALSLSLSLFLSFSLSLSLSLSLSRIHTLSHTHILSLPIFIHAFELCCSIRS